MADQDPRDLMGESFDAPDEQVVSTRGASVRLRDAGVTGMQGPRMDPANQSLADALRFTYGLLMAVMVALFVLFIFSGMRTINEGERGISIRFGKPTAQNIDPGWSWTFPYPMGELIRVGEGTVELKIAREFMPYTSRASSDDELMALPVDQFTRESKLNPARAFSNITADLNLAHTQWTVNYRRTSHEQWAENVLPDQEQALVRAAVQRGVVHTLADVTIDDLLKQGGSGDAISSRVREIAQRSLNDAQSGITIERVVLGRKVPPISLLRQFADVQAAAQRSAQAREDALRNREQKLNETAGRAAPVLIELINEYERLVELEAAEEAEALLARIDGILEGRAVEVNGQVVAAGLIGGEVAAVVNQARGRVSTMVSQAIADRDYFLAKQKQFESNPSLMIVRDWSAAMGAFLERDFVQAMMLPEGVTLTELLISQDPDIVKELVREKNRQEALKALDARMEQQRQDAFRSRRGIEDPNQ
ncbi:MAG: hypothetical protein D6692_07715 [Planctomycetota bacterium]|nr:MAG: hypothetical protein D6692_07715 [Planctomycetota bacterium]